MVYAFNDTKGRAQLWNQLENLSLQCTLPWAIAGDFNSILHPEERIGGSNQCNDMLEFQECVDKCGLTDIKATGALYTWNNKQDASTRIYSRLDRFMINQDWCETFPDLQGHFHPEGMFDHTPCVVASHKSSSNQKRNFKYFNMWGKSEKFKEIVRNQWQTYIKGTTMFAVIKKLKGLKNQLKILNKECYHDIENTTNIATMYLEKLQIQLQQDPLNQELAQAEIEATKSLKELSTHRDSYLQQKSKANWLNKGDSNTAYFHGIIKHREMKNNVMQIENQDGKVCTDAKDIQQAFIDYYHNLLGSSNTTEPVQTHIMHNGNCCTEQHKDVLLNAITNEEIKKVLMSIPNEKSPGPDGYTSAFYKDAWEIVEADICKAIHEFFDNGQLLQQINSTTITLIPKVDRPTSVKQFRPIACCNVIYKIISKLMCNRIAQVLPDIISLNQGAFVKGRSIIENVLICQDLVRMYNRSNVSPRCLFKLDLQKAYDSLEWDFIEQVLKAFKFPEKFCNMIMTCIRTPTYTINLNGTNFGYIQGRRGLRQGDPMSPLIFVMCMEYLTRILHYVTHKWPFKYHPQCNKVKLNHLLFADDLLLFCKGDDSSIILMLRAFASFSSASGMTMNAAKSEVYYNGVPQSVKDKIKEESGIQEGTLPFKYLGVPIKTGKLTKKDCTILVDKMISRLRSLGARKLSYAGRLTLINSVLNTIHTYWSSIFILPQAAIQQITNVCRNYFWDGTADYQRVPLIAWEKVCSPKEEGGLGVKNTYIWNVAAIGKLVDWIHNKKDKLWVKWVHNIYIKNQDWDQYQPTPDTSWYWKQICKTQMKLRQMRQQVHEEQTQYTVSKGYEWLRGQLPQQCWYRFVWNNWNIPKHSITSWIIMREGLNVKNKLKRIGFIEEDRCCLCGAASETHSHLFEECVYTRRIIDGISKWSGIKIPYHEAYKGRAVRAGTKMKRKFYALLVAAYQYHVWRERNDSRLALQLRRPEALIQEITRECKTRLLYLIKLPITSKEQTWISKLGCRQTMS